MRDNEAKTNTRHGVEADKHVSDLDIAQMFEHDRNNNDVETLIRSHGFDPSANQRQRIRLLFLADEAGVESAINGYSPA